MERGTNFEQHVELDVESDVVTVHVPAHNDVDETYFITDTRRVRFGSAVSTMTGGSGSGALSRVNGAELRCGVGWDACRKLFSVLFENCSAECNLAAQAE